MANSYFVSNPTNHLANLATLTQKSALGIEDDVYGQRLRDAAKKSQQFQQHGFDMGQINRTGHLKLADTMAGKGYAVPLNNISSLQQYMQQVAPDMTQGRMADRFKTIGEGLEKYAGSGYYPQLTDSTTAFGLPQALLRRGLPTSAVAAANMPSKSEVTRDKGTKVSGVTYQDQKIGPERYERTESSKQKDTNKAPTPNEARKPLPQSYSVDEQGRYTYTNKSGKTFVDGQVLEIGGKRYRVEISDGSWKTVEIK